MFKDLKDNMNVIKRKNIPPKESNGNSRDDIYTIWNKNSLYRLNSKIKHIRTKDNWTSGHRTIENPNGRRQRKKAWKQCAAPDNLWDTTKQFKVCVVGPIKGEEGDRKKSLKK